MKKLFKVPAIIFIGIIAIVVLLIVRNALSPVVPENYTEASHLKHLISQ